MRLNLGRKLQIVIVPIAIITIGILTLFTFLQSSESILEQEKEGMANTVGKTVQELQSWITDRERESKVYAMTGVFIDACLGKRLEESQERLKILQALSPFNENIFLADTNGKLFMDSIEGKSVGLDISKMPQFVKNVEEARQGRTCVGKVTKSPATGRPVFLVTSPIKHEGKMVGIIGTPVELNYFSDTFVGNQKIGHTGYIYILDEEGLLLAHPKKELILDPVQADTDFGRKIRAMKNGILEYVFHDVRRIAAFRENPANGWIVSSSVPKAEFLDAVSGIRNRSLLFGLAGVLILALAAWLLARSFARPLKATVELMSEMAEGDLSRDVDARYLNRSDEIQSLAQGMQKMITAQRIRVELAKHMAAGRLDLQVDVSSDRDVLGIALREMVESFNDLLQQVLLAVNQTQSGSSQIADASQSLSSGTTEQAASLEEITSSMAELGSQTKANAENAAQANQLAATARTSAENGNDRMRELIAAMDGIRRSSREISKIIKAIDDIAFQTNLLALNAAVEAARAGKHGKGFAVVAQEVRNLAGRSAKAAQETSELIEGSLREVEQGAEVMKQTDEALTEIVDGAVKVTDLVAEIAASSNEQAMGIAQINQGLTQVEQVTQQNTANAEETASAAEELASQARMLRNLISRFKLQIPPEASVAGGVHPAPAVPEFGRMADVQPDRRYRPEQSIALDDEEFGRF